MDEKLRASQQKKDNAVSSVVSEGHAPESAAQKGGVQKSPDVGCKMGAAQGCSKPSTKKPEPILVDSIIIYDEGSPEVKLRMESLFTGEIKYATIKLTNWTQNKLRKCIAEKGICLQIGESCIKD